MECGRDKSKYRDEVKVCIDVASITSVALGTIRSCRMQRRRSKLTLHTPRVGVASERSNLPFGLGRDPAMPWKMDMPRKPNEGVGCDVHTSHSGHYFFRGEIMHSISINMTNLDRKTLPIVEEPPDAEASSFSNLDMDVISTIVEFLDPLSMIWLASTSCFLRELPLSYETVIRNSVLNEHHDDVPNRIYTLLHWNKEVQTIDLPSPLCLLRMINITRCERCNNKTRGLSSCLLFCDVCGEEFMGSKLYECHNPSEANVMRELFALLKSKAEYTRVYPEYTWDMFLEFHPREGVHSVDATAVATLRQVRKEAIEIVFTRDSLAMLQFFLDEIRTH